MLKESIFAFGLKITSAILTVVFSVLVGRLLGISDFGAYSVIFTIVSIFVVLFQFGMPQVLTRYISRKKRTTGKFNTTLLLASAAISCLLMLNLLPIFEVGFLFVFQPFLSGDNGLVIVGLILSLAISGLVQASLNGLNKAVIGILLFEVFSNLIKVLICGCFYFYEIDVSVDVIFELILLSTFLSLLTGVVVNQKENKTLSSRVSRAVYVSLFKQGSMLLVLSSSWLVMLYSDILLLGWLTSSEEVGGYTVAQRISTMVVILLSAVNSVVAPKLSNYYKAGDMKMFANLVKSSTLILCGIGLCILLIGQLLSEPVMGIWGNEFAAYSMALNILLVGQFVNVATGSVGTSLIMIGKSNTVGKIAAFSAFINILLNAVLIPIYGANGAAAATAFSLSFLNLLYLYFLYRGTGIISIDVFWLINWIKNKHA